MDINQLTPDLTPGLSDLIPLWDTSNGITRKVSLASLQSLLITGAVLSGGLLAGSTVAMLNGGASTVALGTALASANAFNVGLSWPAQSSSSAFAFDAVNGNFVAQRDVKLAEFKVALQASWTNAVTLKLAVFVGPDATPYTLTPEAQAVGNGAVQPIAFSGYAYNPNNLNAVIKAGDKVKLAASLSTAGNLSVTAAQFVVQSLDGV